MNRNYFVLYQDCSIIKGAKNILLCDSYRNKIINITGFYSLFQKDKFLANTDYNNELISELLSEELGYLTDDIQNIETEEKKVVWYSPNLINEVIIEHKEIDDFDIYEVYSLFETLRIGFLQIRFLEFSFAKLQFVCSLLSDSCVRTVEIMLPYINERENSELIKFLKKNDRIQIVYFYCAPYNKSERKDSELFNVVYYEKNLTNEKFCGIVNEDYFINDIRNISKAKKFNNCLKDKLFISHNAEIKTCPSQKRVITSVNKLSIDLLIEDIENDIVRNISKDQIEVCKDCEYRYFCNDCRAYVEDPGNEFSKPLKCGYNPYTGKWKEWSKNPLKQKTIKYYGLEEII